METLTTIKPEDLRGFQEQVARAAFWNNLAQWSYTAYFTAFAIGALLLLLFVFLPDRKAGKDWLSRLGAARRLLGQWGAALLLILLCISQQTRVDERRGFIAEFDKRYDKKIRELGKRKDKEEVLRAQYMYMPEGNSLAYMTLGNTNIAADYIWLTSLQYITNSFRRGQKFDMLNRFYHTMVELDPHWVEAQVNAGKVLSAIYPNRDAVEKFYIAAIVQNPDNAQLAYEAGRLFVVPPMNPDLQKDYSSRAVAWFQNATEKLRRDKRGGNEKSIKAIQDLLARLAIESDYYEIADKLLWDLAHDEENPKTMRAVAARDWLRARSLVIVSKLQKAVDAHKTAQGAPPPDLGAVLPALAGDKTIHLDSTGWPLDAFGFRIDYEPATGKVQSRGVNAWRTVQAASVVSSLIEVYRGENQDRPPKDMATLQTFVRIYYTRSVHRLTHAIQDAIGEDLNTTISPLGEPWKYNPETGVIDLPEICDPKMLFQSAKKIVPEE